MDTIHEILEFWFQGVNDEMHLSGESEHVQRWFQQSENFDHEIREKFDF